MSFCDGGPGCGQSAFDDLIQGSRVGRHRFGEVDGPGEVIARDHRQRVVDLDGHGVTSGLASEKGGVSGNRSAQGPTGDCDGFGPAQCFRVIAQGRACTQDRAQALLGLGVGPSLIGHSCQAKGRRIVAVCLFG